MAKSGKGSKKPEEQKKAITSDSRFASVHNDPRFKLPNSKNVKIKIDDRFSKKELEKLNSTATGKKVKIDRYGRKLKKDDTSKDFKKYYEHENEDENEDESEDEDEKSDKEASVSSTDSSDSEEEVKAKPQVSKQKKDDVLEETSILDRARGEGLASSSEDEGSNSDSNSSASDSESEEESEEESEIELEDTKPEEGEPSDSFAVVNMDWDNLKAVDLMATFISFVPTGGSIKSVTIFPSEFGKEQMQKEETEGPPRELFQSQKKRKDDSSDSEDDDELDLKNADDLEKAARKLYTEDDGEEDYDSKALRRYQLQRLRYFYAVVRCDSVGTAKNIYDNCDGTEYESTANIFDLRYIPEGMDFDDSEAKDKCTKIPSSYKPNSTFVTDALQHSKVKLTWDETPKERLTLSSRQFSQKEIDEMDFKAYLASDSGESDNEENDNNESLKDKYRSLLGGSGFSFDNKKGDKEEEEEVDMEITFNPGLDESKISAPSEGAEQSKEESTIEAYRRKEKERRQRRLDKYKESQNDDEDVQEVTKDKKHKNKKDKKKGKPSELDEKRKAELELIMMDEHDENEDSKADHFNMRDIVKAEKAKGKKGKKNKKKLSEDALTQDNFEADLNDPRFKEIFENHDYAIDPTSSEFKKTQTMNKILKERSKRHRYDGADTKSNKKHKKDENDAPNGDSVDLQSLVSKLKRKTK